MKNNYFQTNLKSLGSLTRFKTASEVHLQYNLFYEIFRKIQSALNIKVNAQVYTCHKNKTMKKKILEEIYTCLHTSKVYKMSVFTSITYCDIQIYMYIYIYIYIHI